MLNQETKVVAIVGPTASGKSRMAMELARRFNGEIIAADSRTIYRGLDIGTAKPSISDREEVRHHLLDIVNPGEPFTVAQFKRLAELAVMDIGARGYLPIMVGGSGLYIDSVVYDYQFPGAADPDARKILDGTPTEELVVRLVNLNPSAEKTVDLRNRRRVIRAIETAGMDRSKSVRAGSRFLVLGVTMNKEVAQIRIKQRLELMLREGILDEVLAIAERYGWDCDALRITGYSAFKRLALGLVTSDAAVNEAVLETMKLYKRQMTWFKRNRDIQWVSSERAALSAVTAFVKANV
jgi:tRNA dimethylallyltransferase